MSKPNFGGTLKLSRPRSKPADNPGNQNPIKKPGNSALADALVSAKAKQATAPKVKPPKEGQGKPPAKNHRREALPPGVKREDVKAVNRARNEAELQRKLAHMKQARDVIYSFPVFRDYLPLKIGIHRDVLALPELANVSKSAIRTVLDQHCNSTEYKRNRTSDESHRFGLDGL